MGVGEPEPGVGEHPLRSGEAGELVLVRQEADAERSADGCLGGGGMKVFKFVTLYWCRVGFSQQMVMGLLRRAVTMPLDLPQMREAAGTEKEAVLRAPATTTTETDLAIEPRV